jgi:hypothetical protein
VLDAHVAGAGAVVADEDGAEAGRDTPCLQLRDIRPNFVENGFGDGAPGEQLCGHVLGA